MTKQENAVYMAKLVKKFQASGQSQKDFAAAHGLKEGKLYYWICKLTKSEKPTKPTATSSSVLAKNFVPITVSHTPVARDH